MAKQLKTMDTRALLDLRGKIDAILEGRRKDLEAQLAAFNSGGGHVVGNGLRASKKLPGTRAKAKPKYQSKKDTSLKWSGRGMTPVWMKAEMKGTKLTKESFLIK